MFLPNIYSWFRVTNNEFLLHLIYTLVSDAGRR